MDGSLLRSRWAAIGAAIAVALGGGVVMVARAAESPSPTSFVPVVPCRLMDTRDPGVGPRTVPLGAAETYSAVVWGTNGYCTIPTAAVAVSLNVTAVNGTAKSFLTVFPTDKERPTASSLNWLAGAGPTPNAVTVALSADGRVSFFNNAGTVNVIADIVGYYQLQAAGPPGPEGPAGPEGPTGPAGPGGKSVEFYGLAPSSGVWSVSIPDLPPGRYEILLEAYVTGGMVECYAVIDPTNPQYPIPKYLGRYTNDSFNSTRAFRLMRLDSLGTIGIECTSYAGSPTFMDGMLAVIPVG